MKLAPHPTLLKMDEDKYIPKFNEMLMRISPVMVMQQLNDLAQGNDIALLCYESSEKFCHRHLVAEWLNKHFPEQQIKEFDPKVKKKFIDTQMSMF